MTKLAIPFSLYNPYTERADELNLKFLVNSSASKMLNFLTEYSNIEINIAFQEIDFQTIKQFISQHDKLKIRFIEKPTDINVFYSLQNIGAKYFIDGAYGCAYDWTSLSYLVESLGVSDVYLADELWYDLPKVKNYCTEHNVQIRFVANRIPATREEYEDSPKAPIFSPQDMVWLNNYIDVIEFECGTPYKWNKFNVLYRHWIEKQDWWGDLREINDDLTFSIFPRSIPRRFSLKKIQCQQKCKTKPDVCNSCSLYYQMHLGLVQKGLGFIENT